MKVAFVAPPPIRDLGSVFLSFRFLGHILLFLNKAELYKALTAYFIKQIIKFIFKEQIQNTQIIKLFTALPMNGRVNI